MLARHEVAILTDGAGAATAYSLILNGTIEAIRYVPHASTPLDTNADVTITADASGLAVLTITNINTSALDLYPRAATVTVANAAALYAAGGVAVLAPIPVADERLKFVVAQGAAAKAGTFHVYVRS